MSLIIVKEKNVKIASSAGADAALIAGEGGSFALGGLLLVLGCR